MATEIKKLIAWSYPTSDNAKKANMYNTGCYSVETVSTGLERGFCKFIKGFATLEEAKEFSNTLPYSVDRFCITNY